MLNLYSIFHLNLAYSSIPEEKRKEVIDRCFWPLLRLAMEEKIPVAIEAPAYTLEVVQELDPQWMKELARAISEKTVEFIGAGYSQLIAPIVPYRVNEWNLEIGGEVYKKLLGHVPDLWYINEQTYSAGIVEQYKKIRAKAIVMEWNNPRTLHPEWNEAYRYHPQVAVGVKGKKLPLIWNDSIIFQKFQRVAHGDIEADDFLSYIVQHAGRKERFLCMYGNDAEIFDFRPGRFKAEPKLSGHSEWEKIRALYLLINMTDGLRLVFPSAALDARKNFKTRVPLALGSSVQPIPVKKQPKYNVTRWTVTGYNNLYVNTVCFEIYENANRLIDEKFLSDKEIKALEKEICYLWSSDFRSHITAHRWNEYLKRLTKVRRSVSSEINLQKDGTEAVPVKVKGYNAVIHRLPKNETGTVLAPFSRNGCRVDRGGRLIDITTPSVAITLNQRRGLTIHSLRFPTVASTPLVGTIPHGHFRDIALSSDWYTANFVLQCAGRAQVTDLEYADPVLARGTGKKGEWISCAGTVATEYGPVEKRFTVYRDIPQVDMEFFFDWKKIPAGSLKVGALTLVPESFNYRHLFYATHNGGSEWEMYKMTGHTIAHNAPGSSVVTASTGLGATEGLVVIGDSKKSLAVFFDHALCAAMPMISYREAHPSFFARVNFSCGEIDESRIKDAKGPLLFACRVIAMKR